MFDQIVEIIKQYPYVGVAAVFLLCGLGLPLPEEFVLLAGGAVVRLRSRSMIGQIDDVNEVVRRAHHGRVRSDQDLELRIADDPASTKEPAPFRPAIEHGARKGSGETLGA